MNATSRTAETEHFRFTSQALPDETLHVVRFKGREGLNELFSFTIDLVSSNPALNVSKLLSDRATFRILRKDGREAVFCGYPAGVEQSGYFNGYSYYTVELRPTFWKMTQIVQSWIFLEQTLKDTVQELLRSQKFFTFPHKMEFTRSDYPKRDFAMQYDESIYDYLCWRLEDQGAYYYFAQSEQEDTVCFADGPIAHSALPDDPMLTYSPVSGLEGEHVREILQAFSLKQTQRPKRVVIRSHSWKNPNKPIVGMADVSPDGLGDVYLTDEDVEDDADANRLAQIRAEALRCRERVFSGESSIPGLRPGYTFTLKDHYNPGFNQEYLITDVTHEGSQESFINLGLGIPLEGVQDHLFYRNSFHCIEAARPFRPEKRAPRAKIAGVVHAFIDGAKADARPELDSLGRYKILFPFDISGRSKGKASCWVRMAQQQVGKNSGMSFPLLGGTEVLVSFVDGNPDRPYITGALANAETGALVGNMNSNISGLSTAGGNQLTFNDTAKKQGIDLRTASGSGLFMSSGSLDTTLQNNSFHFGYSGMASSTLSGIASSVESGYKSSQTATSEITWRKMIPKILEQVGNNVLGAYGAEGEKEMADAVAGKDGNDIDHGRSLALVKTHAVESLKAVCTLVNFGYEYFTFKKNVATSYVNTVFASDTKASSSQEIYPDWTSIIAMITTDLLKLAVTVFANESAKAKIDEDENEKKISVPTDQEILDARTEANNAKTCLDAARTDDEITAATARKNIADKTLKDLQDKNKIKGDNAEQTAAKTYFNSLSNLSDEDPKKIAARLRLKSANAAVTSNNNAAHYTDVKKELATHKEWVAIISELLPELLALITLWRTGQGTPLAKRGGILLNSKDANINMLAKDAIALQSDHGMWLRTGNRFLDKVNELYGNEKARQSWGSRDIDTGDLKNHLFNFYNQEVMKNVATADDLQAIDFLADSTGMRYTDAKYLVQIVDAMHKTSANKHIIAASKEESVAAALTFVNEAKLNADLAQAELTLAQTELASATAEFALLKHPVLYTRKSEIEKAVQKAAQNNTEAQSKLGIAQTRLEAINSTDPTNSAIVVQNQYELAAHGGQNRPQNPNSAPGIYLTSEGEKSRIVMTTDVDGNRQKASVVLRNGGVGLRFNGNNEQVSSLTMTGTNLVLQNANGGANGGANGAFVIDNDKNSTSISNGNHFIDINQTEIALNHSAQINMGGRIIFNVAQNKINGVQSISNKAITILPEATTQEQLPTKPTMPNNATLFAQE
ncbi:hypothetical protein FACS189475_00740 [Betaproteobacteria bacterium]|nr:hypothetical protein FACS189475_00740 [Betaproteobacteria bacterium]